MQLSLVPVKKLLSRPEQYISDAPYKRATTTEQAFCVYVQQAPQANRDLSREQSRDLSRIKKGTDANAQVPFSFWFVPEPLRAPACSKSTRFYRKRTQNARLRKACDPVLYQNIVPVNRLGRSRYSHWRQKDVNLNALPFQPGA